MADHFLSLNLMLQEELAQLDNVCREVQRLAQFPATARSRMWVAISDAIEATPITQADLETSRVDNVHRLLRMGTAKAASTLGEELAQQALDEVVQTLLDALDQLFPYLITLDYITQQSGLQLLHAPSAVQEIQSHWSASAIDDEKQSKGRTRRSTLLSSAYRLPDLLFQLSQQSFPDSVSSVADLKAQYLQSTQLLVNQFFQSQAIEREREVTQLIVYWCEEIKAMFTHALYAKFATQIND